MSSRIKYFVVSSSTCLTLLLLLGWGVGRGASQDDTLKHIGVFSEVVGYIEKQYVEEPDMKSVTMGALDGMLEAIDPFASYLNADQYRDYLKTKDAQARRRGTGALQALRNHRGGGCGAGIARGQGGLHDGRHDREHQGRRDAGYAAGVMPTCCCKAMPGAKSS